MSVQKIKCQLRISHYTSNRPPYRGVTLEVIDETSGIHFVELELTHEQLGRVLGSMSVECDGEVRGLNLVGMKRETASIKIPRKKELYKEDQLRKYLEEQAKPYEVDGWMVSIDSMLRTQQGSAEFYHGHKVRYVPAPAEVQAEVEEQ